MIKSWDLRSLVSFNLRTLASKKISASEPLTLESVLDPIWDLDPLQRALTALLI